MPRENRLQYRRPNPGDGICALLPAGEVVGPVHLGDREPAEAAEELLHLLARRRFAWVILSDEVLLEALLAGGNAAALSGWFPFDPADRRVTDLLLSKHAFAERLKGLHIAIPASRFASSARQALVHAFIAKNGTTVVSGYDGGVAVGKSTP